MRMPPDPGREYAREHERKLEEEAHLQEARTGRPSELLKSRRARMRRSALYLLLAVGVLMIALFVMEVVRAVAG